jgi:hypothetical protein
MNDDLEIQVRVVTRAAADLITPDNFAVAHLKSARPAHWIASLHLGR